MTHNEVLRKLCFIFDLNPSKVLGVISLSDYESTDYALSGHQITEAIVENWLKEESDSSYQAFGDVAFAAFLDGFISDLRGKKDAPEGEDVKESAVAKEATIDIKLTNNLIFLKLKIALELQADDVLKILKQADLILSKNELSAFFRKPGNKHYRDCKDKTLQAFLDGLQKKYREED